MQENEGFSGGLSATDKITNVGPGANNVGREFAIESFNVVTLNRIKAGPCDYEFGSLHLSIYMYLKSATATIAFAGGMSGTAPTASLATTLLGASSAGGLGGAFVTRHNSIIENEKLFSVLQKQLICIEENGLLAHLSRGLERLENNFKTQLTEAAEATAANSTAIFSSESSFSRQELNPNETFSLEKTV